MIFSKYLLGLNIFISDVWNRVCLDVESFRKIFIVATMFAIVPFLTLNLFLRFYGGYRVLYLKD